VKTGALSEDEGFRIEVPPARDTVELLEDPGKIIEPPPPWCYDLEDEIHQNQLHLLEVINRENADIQGELESLAACMKAKLERATQNQKEQWRMRRQQTFTETQLGTRLIDMICSFESRWTPHAHCACPLCREQDLSPQQFACLADFTKHMKDKHKVGWKNVKNSWSMIFTKALGVTVISEAKTLRANSRTI
jgi:hypothetical protein